MSSFPQSPTVKVGYEHVNSGGSVQAGANGRLFSVFDVLQKKNTQNPFEFLITLRTEGTAAPGYARGNTLTYNSKGTNNHNADTNMNITTVVGPFQFICSSPTALNG
ncbi:hypothetical protein KCU78_g169, partial [Aureobasidium melanogenum]